MRTPLEQSVLASIRASRLIVPGDRLAVAVSAGGDSLALLRLLDALRTDLGITLLVVHFNHGLRGAESDEDARFVAELARTRGIGFVIGGEDVAAIANQNGWNLEDAGRRLRYEFFRRLVEEGCATRVAVAHTADDQAETVLAHIMRGTGPAGLAGIHPATGSVVRPLLGFRREDLRSYLREIGQTWREDSTNKDLSRTRARIREQLLPQLQRDFSPQVVGRLSDLARLSMEEAAFWSALVEDRFRSLVQAENEMLSISTSDLLAPLGSSLAAQSARVSSGENLPDFIRPLTERLIRKLYETLRGDCRGLGAGHVEQVIQLATESSSGRQAQLPGGIGVEKRFGHLVFSHAIHSKHASRTVETTSTRNAYQYAVDLPIRGEASVHVPELGTCFHLKVIDWPFAASETKQGEEFLDVDLLLPPLILRNWRAGDSYRPRGRRTVRKLKQMFLSGRVPSDQRKFWPVLESAGQVVWTRGMPPADEYSARKGTRAGVMIQEELASK
jgi:tRNA(Ile)-lysidine synthase